MCGVGSGSPTHEACGEYGGWAVCWVGAGLSWHFPFVKRRLHLLVRSTRQLSPDAVQAVGRMGVVSSSTAARATCNTTPLVDCEQQGNAWRGILFAAAPRDGFRFAGKCEAGCRAGE
eukprot:7270051-Prymnesium_polylepis.2